MLHLLNQCSQRPVAGQKTAISNSKVVMLQLIPKNENGTMGYYLGLSHKDCKVFFFI